MNPVPVRAISDQFAASKTTVEKALMKIEDAEDDDEPSNVSPIKASPPSRPSKSEK
jgi:hypothetical protein